MRALCQDFQIALRLLTNGGPPCFQIFGTGGIRLKRLSLPGLIGGFRFLLLPAYRRLRRLARWWTLDNLIVGARWRRRIPILNIALFIHPFVNRATGVSRNAIDQQQYQDDSL
jgi:hypothetical protein